MPMIAMILIGTTNCSNSLSRHLPRRCSHEFYSPPPLQHAVTAAVVRLARLDLAGAGRAVGISGHHQRLHRQGILLVPVCDEQRRRVLPWLREAVVALQRVYR